MSEKPMDKLDEESLTQQRASDAKFYLTIGSGGFFVIGLILIIPVILQLPFPVNIISSFFISSLGYLVPGAILFIWGILKVYRGKDLTFNQVWQAKIQTKDIRKVTKFLVFVTFFVVLLILPVLIGHSIVDIMVAIIMYWYTAAGRIGIHIGVFIISIFGNFTVVFPVPYIVALIFVVTIIPHSFPEAVILGVIAGAGAAIGETTAWLLGRTQTEALEDSATGRQLIKLRKQIERGYGGIVIFIYAATPLPDDMLLITLGATKYPLWKALLFCFLGKVALTLIVAIGATHPLIAPILLEMFGGAADPILETLYFLIGIAIIGLFLVPWGQVLAKIKGSSQSE